MTTIRQAYRMAKMFDIFGFIATNNTGINHDSYKWIIAEGNNLLKYQRRLREFGKFERQTNLKVRSNVKNEFT